MADSHTAILEVVAAVIHNNENQVLLTYRDAKQHQGERWEFPGGKVEPGELLNEALVRELNEELGITPTDFTPFLTLTHAYPERVVKLHFYEVWQFDGQPHGRENQPMQWWGLTALPHLPFPEANVPVLKALQLPEQWFVLTAPSAKAEQQLQQALDTGQVGGVYLRGDYSETQLKRLVLQCQQALCLTLLPARNVAQLDASVLLAVQLGISGIHLPEGTANQLTKLPSSELLYFMACHHEKNLLHAQSLGVDMAFLSPVKHTGSHPSANPL